MLLLALLACEAERAEILIDPPEGTTSIELTIIAGSCPSAEALLDGSFACGPVLHRERVVSGDEFTMRPSIDGAHAIIVTAHQECRMVFACSSHSGPASVRLDSFEAVNDGCGERRTCSAEQAECSAVECTPVDGGVPVPDVSDVADGGPDTTLAEGDDDGDGLTNVTECCFERECCVEDECRFIRVLDCVHSDEDGVPDYLDDDSDSDGYPDIIECPGGLCDYDGDGQLDTRRRNSRGDYDDDGISNRTECLDDSLIECGDTDFDGYHDGRDLDSDDDGLSDSVECPAGAPCPDSNNDGVPDFLDGTSEPLDCGCDDVPYSCSPSGTVCCQTGIDGGDDIRFQWLDFGGATLGDTQVLGETTARHEPPPMAWRCVDPAGCSQVIAVAAVEVPSAPETFFMIDIRAADFDRDLSPLGEIDYRVGRFIYTLGGVVSRIE